MNKAAAIRDLVMTSSIGQEYGDASKITEVWGDLLTPKNPDKSSMEGVYCLRICDIFYDIVGIVLNQNGYSIQSLVMGLANKASSVSRMMGRLIPGDLGTDKTNFDWEKVSEKDEPEIKAVFGDAYSEGDSEVCWGEDLSLDMSIGGNDLVRVTKGPVTVAQGKLMINAIVAYAKRCDRFLNPLPPVQRKPRTKKSNPLMAPAAVNPNDAPTTI